MKTIKKQHFRDKVREYGQNQMHFKRKYKLYPQDINMILGDVDTIQI